MFDLVLVTIPVLVFFAIFEWRWNSWCRTYFRNKQLHIEMMIEEPKSIERGKVNG